MPAEDELKKAEEEWKKKKEEKKKSKPMHLKDYEREVILSGGVIDEEKELPKPEPDLTYVEEQQQLKEALAKEAKVINSFYPSFVFLTFFQNN